MGGRVEGFIEEWKTVVLGDEEVDVAELYFILVVGFEAGMSIGRLKIFIFEDRLFFNPLLAPVDGILVAGHLDGDDSIFVELLFFCVKGFNRVLTALGEFFNLPAGPL